MVPSGLAVNVVVDQVTMALMRNVFRFMLGSISVEVNVVIGWCDTRSVIVNMVLLHGVIRSLLCYVAMLQDVDVCCDMFL